MIHKIENIQLLKDGTMCRLFLNNGEFFEVYFDILIKRNLKQGSEVSNDELESILQEHKFFQARKEAFDYVSYKPRNSNQVKRKLRDIGYDEVYIEDAINHLRDLNYLDDEKFAESYIRDVIKFKSYSRIQAKEKLISNGVHIKLAEKILNKYYNTEIEINNAIKEAEKRLKTIKTKDIRMVEKKVRDSLIRKGFSYEIVIHITKLLEI